MKTTLRYLFDPLCGWCYASAQGLAALAQAYPDALELMPSGLFSGDGARPMSPIWAAHAWRNDQKIEHLTGQHFSEVYRTQVLHGPDLNFDSTFLNRALTAVREIDPILEPRYLNAIQIHRYVNGLDTAQPETLAEIVAKVMTEVGVPMDAAQFAKRLNDDATLAEVTEERIVRTQRLMGQLGISGVPQLLVKIGNAERILQGEVLYLGAEALLNLIENLIDRPPQDLQSA